MDLAVRLDHIGAIAGPLTLVSALAYYIGSVRQEALARYFGLDTSLLQLSSRDYVVRSTDALVRFVAGLCVVALLLVAAHLLMGAVLAQRPTMLKAWSVIVAVVGVAAIVAGGWRLMHPVRLDGFYLLGPASLATGALLLGFGARRLAPSPVPDGTGRWVSRVGSVGIVALVLVGMFWGANDYARAQGRARAVELARSLRGLPAATVYSEAPLGLGTTGVQETSTGSATHPQYRYVGLRLLMRSEDAFFLIPEVWTPSDGSVVMLADRAGVRLEFSPRSSP
jgi:hypothetical protein